MSTITLFGDVVDPEGRRAVDRRGDVGGDGAEQRCLDAVLTGLATLFDDNIFSATQVAHDKPAPDLYLFAASAMGAAAERCVAVEDTVLGVKAVVAAGMAGACDF